MSNSSSATPKGGWSPTAVVVSMIIMILLSVTLSAITGVVILKNSPQLCESLGLSTGGQSEDHAASVCECDCEERKDTYYPTVTIFDSTLQTEGEIDKKDVLRLLKSKRHALRACYAPGLKKDHNLKGEFGLQFTVIQSGRVRVAIERNTEFPDAAVKKCIIKEVESWKMPKEYRNLSVVKVDTLFAPVTNTGTY